jgi:outer membrane immunogenic protein
MKKLLGAIAISALFAAPALAADLPARMPVKAAPAPIVAVYNWTGFYIGAHGGYGWGEKQWTETTLAAPRPEGSFDVNGPLAGGQIGFNFQTGMWVFGVEAQASWARIDGDRASLAFPAQRIHTRADALGTFAGRLGVAFNNVLVYGKGGAAWVHDKYSVSGTAVASWDDTRWGWMAGGGVEVALSPNWSIKGEYNFMDFGTERYNNIACTGACTPFNEDVKQHIHVVKFGVNYRFGGPVVARY